MKGAKKKHVNLEDAERLAALGLTMEGIAQNLGMSESTIYERIAENPEISEVIKRGRMKGVRTIAGKLFKSAADGNTTAQIFYLKSVGGFSEKSEVDVNVNKAPELIVKLSADGTSSTP